jgi:hypothetical protein
MTEIFSSDYPTTREAQSGIAQPPYLPTYLPTSLPGHLVSVVEIRLSSPRDMPRILDQESVTTGTFPQNVANELEQTELSSG